MNNPHAPRVMPGLGPGTHALPGGTRKDEGARVMPGHDTALDPITVEVIGSALSSIVEEMGEALGVTYADDEELKAGEKERSRDKHRWELDPASSDDYQDRTREQK